MAKSAKSFCNDVEKERRGERGRPCLNPLFMLNCPVGDPFTKIEIEAVETH